MTPSEKSGSTYTGGALRKNSVSVTIINVPHIESFIDLFVMLVLEFYLGFIVGPVLNFVM
jgi:hypothetical protein